MGRGGYRKGAGRKAGWRHGETQTIRVPLALREQLLEIARQLDNSEFIRQGTHSELNALLDEWQTKCDAEPANSTEWQKVRQLISEIKELIFPEALVAGKLAEIEVDEWYNRPSLDEDCCHHHGRHNGHRCDW